MHHAPRHATTSATTSFERARHAAARAGGPRSRRLRVAAMIAAAAAATGVVAVGAPSAVAMGKIKCKLTTGYAAVDPIVNHNQAGASAHGHTFFGNASLLSLPNPNAATYNDMVGKPTNCENPDDSAGYWEPTLLYTSGSNAGKPVPIKAFAAYYRSFDHKETGVAAPVPADTRLIAGNPMASSLQSTNVVNWTCGQFSSVGPTAYIPNCAAATGKVVQLTAHVTFPSCWDGGFANHNITGDTRDNAHWAYAVKGGCPSGFPNKITELRETINFSYAGTGADVALASDLMARKMGMNVRNGQTLHGDYWNTWRQTGGTYGGMVDMVKRCVNTFTGPAAECG